MAGKRGGSEVDWVVLEVRNHLIGIFPVRVVFFLNSGNYIAGTLIKLHRGAIRLSHVQNNLLHAHADTPCPCRLSEFRHGAVSVRAELVENSGQLLMRGNVGDTDVAIEGVQNVELGEEVARGGGG